MIIIDDDTVIQKVETKQPSSSLMVMNPIGLWNAYWLKSQVANKIHFAGVCLCVFPLVNVCVFPFRVLQIKFFLLPCVDTCSLLDCCERLMNRPDLSNQLVNRKFNSWLDHEREYSLCLTDRSTGILNLWLETNVP